MKCSFILMSIRSSLFLILMLVLTNVFGQCPQPVWADEFDGTTLDLSKWTAELGNGCDVGLCGWGNNELEYYTDKSTNLSVSGGFLTITALKERTKSNSYTSGRIKTMGKGDWTYGRMEARMKLPIGQGMWPAFWMLPTDNVYGGWPQSGEIDIMENIGNTPDVVYGTIHYGDPYPNNKSTGGKYLLPTGNFNDGFHIFALEWQTNVVRWYVDGILYATRTNADVSPSPWPFDQRFYIIMNLAVGGNWPGSPDATTVFPQTMVVDYVRVYNTSLPYITGPDLVQLNQTGINYSVTSVPGANYSWTVPSGAVIKSGQGTSSIVVDWGTSEGQVKVTISQSCGSSDYAKNVYVKPPVNYGFTFENFDDKRNLVYVSSDGTLSVVSNPNPSGVNVSATSGKYIRNSTAQYDNLKYQVSQITDASQYSTRKKKFFVDVYTTAPVNTLVFIQLENNATATATNFPTGRHSRYVAFTTKQNAWDRLEFDLDAVLDASVPNNGVDRMLILFNSNSFTGDTYYFDNVDSYDVGTITSDTQAPSAPANLVSTGKTSSSVSLSWSASTDNVGVTGYDVYASGVLKGTATSTSFNVTGLSASTSYTFTVKAKDAAGNVSAASNAVSVTTDAATVSYIKVEAESYSAMKGVTVEACSDTGGGSDVTSIDIRDYMDYTVAIPTAGNYSVDFRVASTVSTGKLDFKIGSTVLASLTVPNIGGSQTWQTISATVNLSAGTQTFRVYGKASSFSLNWFGFQFISGARIATVEQQQTDGIVAYPNPATHLITIKADNNQIIQRLSFYSELGIVRSYTPNKNMVDIATDEVGKGMFVIKVETNKAVAFKKVIVK